MVVQISINTAASADEANMHVQELKKTHISELIVLADEGNSEAQYKLGVAYSRGEGVEEDPG